MINSKFLIFHQVILKITNTDICDGCILVHLRPLLLALRIVWLTTRFLCLVMIDHTISSLFMPLSRNWVLKWNGATGPPGIFIPIIYLSSRLHPQEWHPCLQAKIYCFEEEHTGVIYSIFVLVIKCTIMFIILSCMLFAPQVIWAIPNWIFRILMVWRNSLV